MAFNDDLNRFARKLDKRVQDIFVGATGEVQKSVVDGSSVTGAPGQPVDTGALRSSWIPEFTSQVTWQTTTGLVYAPIIEDAVGITLRSAVGGFHSVKLTRGGWANIVDHERRRVVGD